MRVLAVLLALIAAPAFAQDAVRGARIFAEACAVCHGADLRGDGPMADVLIVPAPDLTRISQRYGGFPRIGIARVIDGRDPLLSHGGDMPIFGFVFQEMSAVLTTPGGPTLLTSPEVIDLVTYLQSVQE